MAGTPPSKVPPGPNVTVAPRLQGITASLYIVALVLFGARLYTRIRHKRLGWDDYTITFALGLALSEWVLWICAMHYGAGRHNYYVPAADQVTAQHLLFATMVPWAACMMFIKISIACMLLRIKHSPPWRIFLWSMIAIQVASCTASLVFQLVQCFPLAAVWDRAGHPNARCAKKQSSFISLYVNSAIGISTDLILATVPISFIRTMHCPLREKIVLCCLMGLGVFATACSIVKTSLVTSYGKTGDALWDGVDLTLWSVLEEQTGILAACIPCLKSPFEHTLRHLGILSSPKHGGAATNYLNYTTSSHPSGTRDSRSLRLSQQLRALRPAHYIIEIHTGCSSLTPPGSTPTSTSSSGHSAGTAKSAHSAAPAQSEDSTWPRAELEHVCGMPHTPQPPAAAQKQRAAKEGIVKTTEFHVRSEVLGRAEGDGERETSVENQGGRAEAAVSSTV
ncbi:hypothetical protein BDV95DRAFT_607377 [Massariosphaeria phaeospora]|uniref:Rhodopsin domain-containing protein n=1 Tax=Massariosphaeria phaeospora TaxID=100035 RepID=A0A7C8M7T5_9PLEO|nr:hypothetical protein BDV95DRAFT_607377 [Massariosphaeria phaeospora]